MTILELGQSVKHYSKAIYNIIFYCKSERDITDILDEMAAYPEFAASANPPHEVLEWILEAGGIERAPEGTMYRATEDGQRFLTENNPSKLMADLMAQEAEHTDIIKGILTECSTPKGMGELEERFGSHCSVVPGETTVNYFVDALAQARALEWSEGWVVTETGKNYLHAFGSGTTNKP